MSYKNEEDRKINARKYYLKNKEKIFVYNKNKREKDPFSFNVKNTLSKFKGRYGIKISFEEYIKLYKLANGKCEICNNADSRNARVSLDHCHKSLKIRGFLCGKCNMALGVFKDDISLLNNAVLYLKKYK